MGKPENPDHFTAYAVMDIVLYIDNSVIEEYLDKNKLSINIEGYGRQLFEIEE